jgi:hypothetical protein
VDVFGTFANGSVVGLLSNIDADSLNTVNSPIEHGQHTGRGRPSAITHIADTALTNRQQALLDELPEYDSRVTVKKSNVSIIDLAALTAKTGVEFAMFTKKGECLIVRGDYMSVNIGEDDAKRLNMQGYKWSGHTHVGSNLTPSDGDISILKQFSQNVSVIYNSYGDYYVF